MTAAVPERACCLKVGDFSEWLTRQGYGVRGTTNPWEVIRYKADGRVHVVYKNKRDGVTWTGQSNAHYKASMRGVDVKVSSPVKTKTKAMRPRTRKVIKARLLKRDGGRCWFCDETMGDDVTIEHLVPISDGGSHSMANLVLAHKECNRDAGDAPIVDKLAIQANHADKRYTTA